MSTVAADLADRGTAEGLVRRRIRVVGLVQGVGFRPFVHQLANRLGLSGCVGNDGSGVFVEVEGSRPAVDRFLTQVVADAPPLAFVDAVESFAEPPRGEVGFRIVASRTSGPVATYVAPDAAVCEDCVAELCNPTDRRYRYPFITCTNCGPRFTITRSLPYDRANTTMAGFELCAACAAQYEDPADRRFHAQPLACAACGPRLWFEGPAGRVEGPAGRVDGTDPALAAAQRVLAAGGIVAVKGIGGYHLACAATSDAAVELLRARKHRPDKPFAVMARTMAVVERLAHVDEAERDQLVAPARPIVLLRSRGPAGVSSLVAPGSPRLGVMLPYAPLHHLLFSPVPGYDDGVADVLVMTSGNLSDEPICYDDADARTRLGAIADAFLVHDRPIHVPCDDSVVRVVDGVAMPLRRSRGFAPLPLRLPVAAPPMLAVGGEVKNTFCVARGRDAWLGQHIGDMGSIETRMAFERSTRQIRMLCDVLPSLVAADPHPGYHTSTWAERAGLGPVVAVQHHHAHLAALMAEHDVPAATQVLGVVFDGTGLGPDGTIWGGEMLLGNYVEVQRFAHLRPVLLPGGDRTVRRPYRMALAHLWAAGIPWAPDLPPVEVALPDELAVLARQLERGFHCAATSSMGRLFDAVSALLGIRSVTTYEAQAAIELEDQATRGAGTPARFRFGLETVGDSVVMDPRPVLAALVGHLRYGKPVATAASGFHHAVADIVTEVATIARDRTGCNVVGLTGGVFQNAVLLTATRIRLDDRGFRVLTHRLVPPNDGGLALGQVAVAAARAQLGPAPMPRPTTAAKEV